MIIPIVLAKIAVINRRDREMFCILLLLPRSLLRDAPVENRAWTQNRHLTIRTYENTYIFYVNFFTKIRKNIVLPAIRFGFPSFIIPFRALTTRSRQAGRRQRKRYYISVFRCRVLGRTLPVPVPAQREHAVQREFLGRMRRGLSPEQEETQVRKPITIRQRLRAGVRVRAVRHARRLLR